MICQCLKSNGQQCSRHVKDQTNFCWQHQDCKNPIGFFSGKDYNFDWREKTESITMNGYHVLKIPKGTIVYCGVEIGLRERPQNFYALLDTALWYAFMGDRPRGKVKVFQFIKDGYFYDVINVDNYLQLEKDFGENHLKNAFGHGDVRASYPETDDQAMKWLCQNLKLDGWAIKGGMKGDQGGQFHDEIMICQPNQMFKELPYEFRAIPREYNYKPKKTTGEVGDLVLTKDGQIIKYFPADIKGTIKLPIKGFKDVPMFNVIHSGGMDNYYYIYESLKNDMSQEKDKDGNLQSIFKDPSNRFYEDLYKAREKSLKIFEESGNYPKLLFPDLL